MLYIYALLGGATLNLTPCCLPMLALKVVSRRSWTYNAGIVATFGLLALPAIFLHAMWGSHLQYTAWPLAAVCFAMGASYLGAWEFPSFGFRESTSDFIKGMTVVLLASSCSGPFLGVVFASTLTRPPLIILTLFLTVGIGFALPSILVPRSWVPKPGAWMDCVKQAAGVCMIAYGAWLLAGSTVALVVLIVLFWLRTLADGRRRLALSGVYGLALLFLAWFSFIGDSYPVEPFDSSKLEHYRKEGRVVVIDFSARLCANCQVNEQLIQSYSVSKTLSKHNAILMRAMMPNGSSLLLSLGFNSVPVTAVYHGMRKPLVLEDLISQSQIIEALDK